MPTVNDAARITTKDSAVWRTCSRCGLVSPLPPDVDGYPVCDRNQPTLQERYATALGRIDAWARHISHVSDAERLEHIRAALDALDGGRA